MTIKNVYVAKKSSTSLVSKKIEGFLSDFMIKNSDFPIEHGIMLFDDLDEDFDINLFRHELKIALDKDMTIEFATKLFKKINESFKNI